MLFKTKSSLETTSLGYKIGSLLQPCDVILLRGDLAAGKTTFTKGIGSALGIKRTINSPTFTIVKEYNGSIKLNHIDLYRLAGGSGDFELEEYINDTSICVIEWPDILSDYLPLEYLGIDITLKEDDSREIEVCGVGDRYKELVKKLGD